jgi:hypothetical protein
LTRDDVAWFILFIRGFGAWSPHKEIRLITKNSEIEVPPGRPQMSKIAGEPKVSVEYASVYVAAVASPATVSSPLGELR